MTLAGLCVKGQPIVLPVLVGNGPPPTPALVHIELEPLSVEERIRCLNHRALLCGRADPLPEQTLARVAARSAGIGEALSLARAELCRMVFFPSEETSSTPAPAPDQLFPESQMKELGRLLDAISSDRNDD